MATCELTLGALPCLQSFGLESIVYYSRVFFTLYNFQTCNTNGRVNDIVFYCNIHNVQISGADSIQAEMCMLKHLNVTCIDIPM